MISFPRQLLHLLWKVVIIKRRQKISLAIEVLVPIVLFAIIALIRTKDFYEYRPLCHYSSRGFPSSGLLPFVNGFLCSLTNPCHAAPTSGDETWTIGTGQKESILIEGMRAVLEQLDHIGRDPDAFTRDTRLLSQMLLRNDSSSSISKFSSSLFLLPALSRLKRQPLYSFLRKNSNMNESQLIMEATCGQAFDPSQPADLPSGTAYQRTIFDDLKEPIMKFILGASSKSFADGSCGGVKLIDDSACPLFTSPLLSQFRPVLRGRILVAPAGPVAEELVDKLNEPMRYVSFFLAQFPELSATFPFLMENLAKSDLPAAFKTLANFPGFGRLFGNSEGSVDFGRVLKSLLDLAAQYSECFLADRFVIVEDEEELKSTALCLQRSQQYFSGIVLDNINSSTTKLPDIISYRIRHLEGYVDDTWWSSDGWNGTRSRDLFLQDLKYVTYGFAFLQEAVDRSLREMHGVSSIKVGVFSQQEPFPPTKKDSFDLQSFIGLFVILSFVIPCSMLVKNIVYEKEKRLKEVMRIMGLGDAVHFISWAVISLILNCLSSIAIALLLRYGRIFPNAEFSLVLVFLFLFNIATISQAIFLSTFFTNANIATAFTAVFFFLAMFPFQLSSAANSKAFTIIVMIFPQTAIGYGFSTFGHGRAGWSEISGLRNESYNVYFAETMVAFAIDAVVYAILAWYISAIHPGVYGIGRPFYFPVTRSYWLPSRKIRDLSEDTRSDDTRMEEDGFESDPTDIKPSVELRGLSKVYSSGMKAVDDLSLCLYPSQITGLIGHNGAGKTTTMSMLCGLLSPSSGTATIYGHDLISDIGAVRGTLGFCPQQNILFDLMTVKEHLLFFGALKGIRGANRENEVREILRSLDLEEKSDRLVEKLSGGQKRRLCIGIALVGNSRFVILDEPTAGVDVASRRDIWELLLNHKEGRTILLSTHHMDEADVLSDRIALLSQGKLVARGSARFLKKHFDGHYTLVCAKEKTEEGKPWTKAVCLIENMSPTVKAKLVDESEEEITFQIPSSVSSKDLEGFLTVLDENKCWTGITGFGLSSPTLQEVFVRLTSQLPQDAAIEKPSKPSSKFWNRLHRRKTYDISHLESAFSMDLGKISVAKKTDDVDDLFDPSTPPIKRHPRPSRQLKALLTARRLQMQRSIPNLLAILFVPLLLLLICEVYAKIDARAHKEKHEEQKPLVFESSIYGNYTTTYINLWNRTNASAGAKIAQSLLTPPGMGMHCLDPSRCRSESTNGTDASGWEEGQERGNLTYDGLLALAPSSMPFNAPIQSCYGDDQTEWRCTQADYPMYELQFVNTSSSDTIMDVSFRNLSQFRVVTAFQSPLPLKSYNFLGGLGLGHRNSRAPGSEKLARQRRGWRTFRRMLGELSTSFRFNLSDSGTSASSPSDITLDSFVDAALESMETEDVVKIWFNNAQYASLPIYSNVISNALLRPETNSLGINASSHPMSSPMGDRGEGQKLERAALFRVILLLLVLCIIPAGFAVSLVEDRISHSLHLQIISGLTRRIYWATSYACDFATYLLACLVIVILYLALRVDPFTVTAGVLFSFLLLIFVYGLVDLMIVYILQRFFSSSALAFVIIAIGSFFVGVVTTMTVVMVEELLRKHPDLASLSSGLATAFTILVPQYNLGMGLARMTMANQAIALGEGFLKQLNRSDLISSLPYPAVLDWHLAGRHVLALVIQGIVIAAIFVALEAGFVIPRPWRKIKDQFDDVIEDPDVKAEKERVELMKSSEDTGLVVRGLKKTYGSRPIVRGVTFAASRGECFGLLGLNGAGKTTTFGLMTGRLRPDTGEVRIMGERISSSSSAAFDNLGYCPQFDALHLKLTAKENIQFFARLRGVDEGDMEKMTLSLLGALRLLSYADVRAGDLSGGNKRKLSVAIAFICQPSVIMLDEPSAGMDPGSQQFLWGVIRKLRQSGHTIILTSHSMEECEALATRIAVLDTGKIGCIGSRQRILEKFGYGYNLSVKFASAEEAPKLTQILQEQLPKAKLVTSHGRTAFYRIPHGENAVVDLLKAVNEIKDSYAVQDFSLSQTSLDEIFHNLNESTMR